MTHFLDGPAKGVMLALKSSPLFLRVVSSAPCPKWDALDQPGDHPAVGESITVYRLVAARGFAHVRMRGGAGFYPISEYRVITEQPPDDHVHSSSAWRNWCEANHDTALTGAQQS